MQWNDTPQAGFTTAKPWLAVNENYIALNVAEQEIRSDSVLSYFKSMIRLRKNYLTLVYGVFELVDGDNKEIFAYTRELDNQKLLIVLNFSDQNAALDPDIYFEPKNTLIGNYLQSSNSNFFKPYEAVIYEI